MGFLRGLVGALVVVSLAMLGLRHFGVIGGPDHDAASPAALAAQAMDALDAVKKRQPTDRRPASYDAVMAPLDKLLEQARNLVRGENFDPARDMNALKALTTPVLEISDLASAQARRETGPLAKEYRFADQKGEACQYLAVGMWNRISASSPRTASLDSPTPPPAADMNELRRILDIGLDAAPGNMELWYLRGLLNRAEGLFPAAAHDLAKAVDIDPGYAEAWNTLGLVRISLKDFDAAEAALERAKELALLNAKRFNAEPGPEYTAILYNLAMFHEGLASYYNRENRLTPTADARRLMTRHAGAAATYLREFLAREPADSPDARAARVRLEALPR